MSGFRANSIVSRDGTGAPNFPNGIVATGATFTGEISGVNGTFSGNLTIGGTVSYQEVENIDAVGVVTAQQGIQVEANGLTVTGVGTFNNSIEVVGVTTADANGLNVAGVITATSLKGSAANLTGVLPTTSAVASGSISNGQPVIIKSDGKVAGVTTTGIGQTLTSEVEFENGSYIQWVEGTYDSNENNVVFVYEDGGNSNAGTAAVGTVSGTTVTFSTPVVYDSAAVSYNAVTFDSSNNKVVIAYRDAGNSNYGTAIVGTVSGGSINFGTPAVFESATTSHISMTFDSSNNKVVIAYRDDGNSGHGTAIVGTVSGTSISFGSAVVFESASISATSTTFDSSAGKVLIAYRDIGGSNYGTGIVGTVSGTSISFGSPSVFRTGTSSQIESTYDSSNNKHVIIFEDESSSQVGSAVVATVSGTSVSFGSKVIFSPTASSFGRGEIKYDSTSGKVLVAWRDGGNSSKGSVMTGTVVGTSVTFVNKTVYYDGGTEWSAISIDTGEGVSVIGYGPGTTDGGKGRARVFRPAYTSTNLTSSNFLGFSNAAYTDGQTATVQITGSVDDAQSGLTTAKKHYVQTDGTLSTTAGDPSVEAGVAISATEIIVKG